MVQMWMWVVCVCPVSAAYFLSRRSPAALEEGGLLQQQVYLKLQLVYLMNGCRSEEQRGSVHRGSRILMCVFKEKNRKVVIMHSIDTVIRKCLLPWRGRSESSSTDPLLVWKLEESDPEAQRSFPVIAGRSWTRFNHSDSLSPKYKNIKKVLLP